MEQGAVSFTSTGCRSMAVSCRLALLLFTPQQLDQTAAPPQHVTECGAG